MLRFIFIFEDGTVKMGQDYQPEDLLACDDGTLNLIDTTTGNSYFEGQWTALDVVQTTEEDGVMYSF
jgi:hypothetical protein